MFGGAAVLGGVSPFLKSIQAYSVTVGPTQDTNTATIAAINTSFAAVVENGCPFDATAIMSEISVKHILTNTTTVTVTRLTHVGGSTGLAKGYVLEFNPAYVSSVQLFSATMTGAGSATATITAVVVANSFILPGGSTCSSTGANVDRALCNRVLTNMTTVTVARQSGVDNVVCCGTVVECRAVG